jgi:hypothetical protein
MAEKKDERNGRRSLLTEAIEEVKHLRTPLAKRVEEVKHDTLDNDTTQHLAMFLAQFKDRVAMPDIDLRTAEGATAALTTLDKTLQTLRQQQHVAKSLRDLIKRERGSY